MAQTPFRFGDYIAKFSIAPVAPALKVLTSKEIDASDNPNAIRETVRAELVGIEAVWEFRAQLCRDLERQPVEDPTVEWDEAEAPFQRVATITARPQDSWSQERVEAVDERMRFSVWTGLAAHQPLGNINRARNAPHPAFGGVPRTRQRLPDKQARRLTLSAKGRSPNAFDFTSMSASHRLPQSPI